jgi:hypothetical protein
MLVKVQGTSNDATMTGVATTVQAMDAVEGTIDAVGANTITVMGQVVQIEDNVTRLNDDDTIKVFSAAGFAPGQHVEVHGLADDNGGLRASRVVNKISGEFEAKGFVSALGATSFGMSSTSGGAPFVTVNFTADQLPAGVANGSIVEVKSLAAPVGGAVTASLIQIEDSLGASGVKVEIEGYVTSGTLADFFINGQRVITNSATVFQGGLGSDFATGIKLEAEGPLDSSGAIVAIKVSFRSNIKLEGDASGVTASGLTLLGKTVSINQYTRLDNGLPVDGNHVEVRAKLDRDGNLIATRIRVQSADTKAFMQGPISAADSAAGTITILGNTVVSDVSTQWRVSSTSSEVAVTKAEFFAKLKNNVTVVKVRWDGFTSTAAAIKEAEIELGK